MGRLFPLVVVIAATIPRLLGGGRHSSLPFLSSLLGLPSPSTRGARDVRQSRGRKHDLSVNTFEIVIPPHRNVTGTEVMRMYRKMWNNAGLGPLLRRYERHLPRRTIRLEKAAAALVRRVRETRRLYNIRTHAEARRLDNLQKRLGRRVQDHGYHHPFFSTDVGVKVIVPLAPAVQTTAKFYDRLFPNDHPNAPHA